jgi:hypothetical protein
MKNRAKSASAACAFLLIAAALPQISIANTLRVGPGQAYPDPGAAAKAAKDGDTIEIMAGTYTGGVAVWKRNNLTLRGIGTVEIRAAGKNARGMGIWVFSGNNVKVENIAFTGARVRDKNGAGIRMLGANLIVRNCRFIDNENGILAGRTKKNKGDSEIVIEDSLFERNGHSSGRAHGIYVGNIARLTIRGSVFSQTHRGHHIKTRARESRIMFNRIEDGEAGDSSYLVDFAQGGRAFLVGNELHQGPNARNVGMVSFGAEKNPHTENVFFAVNNTFVTDRANSVFLKIRYAASSVAIVNNIFAGTGELGAEEIPVTDNLIVSSPAESPFVSWEARDFSLAAGAGAIDAGRVVSDYEGVSLTPALEVQRVRGTAPRPKAGPIDFGAFEYRGGG